MEIHGECHLLDMKTIQFSKGLTTYETGKANLLQSGTFRLNHTAWWFVPEWGGYVNGEGWRNQTGGTNLSQ